MSWLKDAGDVGFGEAPAYVEKRALGAVGEFEGEAVSEIESGAVEAPTPSRTSVGYAACRGRAWGYDFEPDAIDEGFHSGLCAAPLGDDEGFCERDCGDEDGVTRSEGFDAIRSLRLVE